jgi:hypothetical protein
MSILPPNLSPNPGASPACNTGLSLVAPVRFACWTTQLEVIR